jgi:hypothetical protein
MPGQMVNQMPGQMPGQMPVQMPVQMPGNQMYQNQMVNQGMCNSGGFMTNMYQQQPMNPGFMPYSNPSVQTNIPNSNVTPTTNNNNNVNNNQGNTNDQEPQSLLQRNNELIGDPNAPTGNGIINIFFEASTGSRAVLNISESTPIKDVLKKYAAKIKLNEKFIGKQIMFLYTGKRIDPNSTQTVKELKINNGSQITVFDQANVLGA